MKTVNVTGWRFLSHSYSIVNQFQCLEMLKRPDLRLYHTDAPLFSRAWKPSTGLLTPESESELRAITAPPPGLQTDALLHIAFPHVVESAASARRTFTWATSEYKRLAPDAISSGKQPWLALPTMKTTLIACSNWAAQGFLNCGAPKSRVFVVPCGVDTEIFNPGTPEDRAAARKELGWEDKFVLLNISAITYNKGVDLLLKALAALAPAHLGLTAAIKGNDDLYSSGTWMKGLLKGLAPPVRQAISERVAYMGASFSARQIARLYRAADLYVSPYRAEGFNLPVLEAAACGLPVVCTRGGSTEDFVDDSWCLRVEGKEVPGAHGGVMIEPNFDSFVAQLKRGIADDAWRAAASASGPVWVRERFTWKQSVDKLLKVMFPEGMG